MWRSSSRAQPTDARSAEVAAQRLPQTDGIDEVEAVGLVHRPLERRGGDLAGQVDQRQDRGRDGYAVANLDVICPETHTAMDADSCSAALVGAHQ